MTFFWVFGLLFGVAAIYNLIRGNFEDGLGGLFIATCFFAIFAARRKKAEKEAAKILSQDPRFLRCCKCGRDSNVRQRAYLLTYSVIVYTSKSPGSFQPICDRCSILAGWHLSLATLLVGWWGFPWGPIYTVQAVYRNFRGGVVAEIEMEKNPVATPPKPKKPSPPPSQFRFR